ncbi:hypothetical protein BRARA_A00609, partial [Brassica rapa]
MADPPSSPKSNAPFFVVSLASHNSNPLIPEAFFAAKNELTNLKLTSDACDRTWQVKLNGRRFTEGWEDFSNAHCLRDDDVLLFRDVGQMIFHVTPSGRSFSQIHYISSSSDNIEADEIDDDTDDGSEDEDGDSEDDEGGSKFEDGSHSVKKIEKENNLLVFKSWTLELRHNKTTGQAYMCRGWTSFCKENGIKAGSSCRFKLVKNGTKPTAQMNQNRTVAIDFKPDMLRSGQLRLPALFSRENGINEAGEGRGQFYIRGFKDCFRANGIKKVGDSFTLDVVRGGTSPVLKICSKSRMIQASRAEEEMETRVQKKARVSGEGGSSRPLEPCSISDQVSKVRESNVHTLTDVRQFRSELEIREQNLETWLLEIDALGEKIQGISKFFN